MFCLVAEILQNTPLQKFIFTLRYAGLIIHFNSIWFRGGGGGGGERHTLSGLKAVLGNG